VKGSGESVSADASCEPINPRIREASAIGVIERIVGSLQSLDALVVGAHNLAGRRAGSAPRVFIPGPKRPTETKMETEAIEQRGKQKVV
jgi:hypothetical protein